jgi:hypothetical protein
MPQWMTNLYVYIALGAGSVSCKHVQIQKCSEVWQVKQYLSACFLSIIHISAMLKTKTAQQNHASNLVPVGSSDGYLLQVHINASALMCQTQGLFVADMYGSTLMKYHSLRE